MKKSILLNGFFLIGALSMIVMTMHYFQSNESGILKGKDLTNFSAYYGFFYSHITCGLIAITIGLFQFIKKLIGKKRLHKFLGYTYVTTVIIASITGFVIAQYAMGGWISKVGFSVLSMIWLYTVILALSKIRNGDVQSHKKWMMVNYALTFSALTQRTILLFAFIPHFNFMDVYRSSSWLSWIVNLLIVFIILKNLKYDKHVLA